MKDALLLVNMGGPAGPDEVRPYLRAIFADPMILPLPGPIRALVGAMIVRKRAGAVAARYDLMGGRSPLLAWTEKQTGLLHEAVKGTFTQVVHAYRYSAPTIGDAVEDLTREGVERITLLPLFPHETRAMTGSVRMEATRRALAAGVELRTVPAWGLHPQILSLQETMLSAALRQAGDGARVLFVAHGIPMRDVHRGDPYPEQVEQNATRLGATLPRTTAWSLAYQSRVGPVTWTGPYLEAELARLARDPAPVVIMPLSFVADCLETLYDLDHVAVPWLQERGIGTVVRVPAYNDDARFIASLRQILTEVHDG